MREIITKLQLRADFLKKTIQMIESKEESYPEGSLRIKTKNNKGIYYQRNNKTDVGGVYIPREKSHVAQLLAQKEYEKKYKRKAVFELKAIEKFLYGINPDSCIECYSKLNPVRKKLIVPYEMSDSEYAEKWINTEYVGLGFRDDDYSNYITDAGERVRSKSELLIANMLYKNKIPYKYECPLRIKNNIMYPDFTILNIKKRKIIYWEHFGMMGDNEYCNNALKKILSYSSEDILVGDRLITTFETINTSIDTKYINKIISFYL